MNLLKQYYTTTFAQAFSPCGKFLASGSNLGKVQIFNLQPFLFNDDENFHLENSHCSPIFSFIAHDSPIYSMVSTDTFLITGSVGEIAGWSWQDIKKKESKPCWIWTIPPSESNNLIKPEVNCLAIGSNDARIVIYAGCGDNKIYCWDLELGSILHFFSGHTDYIHCVTTTTNECISGSEDGSVRIWDSRKKSESIHQIQPFKEESLHRPMFGKWIGCVAVDQNEDWMVCGGGPKLCLWHLRSLSPAVPLEADCTSSVALFHEDLVISGGSSPLVYQWNFSGEMKAQVPSSSSHIYSIILNSRNQTKVMSIGGSSHKLDICTNLMYKDFSLIGN